VICAATFLIGMDGLAVASRSPPSRPTGGLLFGGVVTTAVGWRWVFLAVAPLAAAAAALAPAVVPEASADSPPGGRLDILGGLLVTTAMLLALYGLTRVEHSGPVAIDALDRRVPVPVCCWSSWPGSGGQQRPWVRLGILQVKSLRGASLGVGANAAAFTSVVYVGTLYFQTALGYSPLQAGLAA
jgi:hypothetical protein